MTPGVHELIQFDLPALAAALLAAVTCGLLGNFLVLRRMSLMGDAISHAVLPGLVIAFLVAGTRSSWPMFLGAAASGLVTVGLVELVRSGGRVEQGAAMGVVFSALFALGVVFLERASSMRHVDLDPDCVLHGQLELVFWLVPDDWSELLVWSTLGEVPRQVRSLALVFAVAVVFVGLLYKELRISAFDPALARSQGIPVGGLHLALMVIVAGSTVASFEAVGSILVVAMLICPAATARLLTDRMATQLWLSVVIAVMTAVMGYVAATWLPARLGLSSDVNAAGMMTVIGGVGIGAAVVFSPLDGLVARWLRNRARGRRTGVEDVVGLLYRAREHGRPGETTAELAKGLSRLGVGRRAIRLADRAGLAATVGGVVSLTESGIHAGEALIRRHRLWERYLVDEAGIRPDHVHERAETLEHLREGAGDLDRAAAGEVDPHGRAIPPAPDG